jgi:exosortase K
MKRSNIIPYSLSLMLCAASYVVFSSNIALSLLPHKTALEFLFNFNFVFVENMGYEQTGGLFVIAGNCMGVLLFINLFLIMVFGFLPPEAEMKQKIAMLIKYYFSAMFLAFTVTLFRIAASIPFCTWERFHLIHNIISLAVYFLAGLGLYFVMDKKKNRTMDRRSAVS